MGTVERLLSHCGLVEIAVEARRDSPDARYCLSEYYKELDERFYDGFDL